MKWINYVSSEFGGIIDERRRTISFGEVTVGAFVWAAGANRFISVCVPASTATHLDIDDLQFLFWFLRTISPTNIWSLPKYPLIVFGCTRRSMRVVFAEQQPNYFAIYQSQQSSVHIRFQCNSSHEHKLTIVLIWYGIIRSNCRRTFSTALWVYSSSINASRHKCA